MTHGTETGTIHGMVRDGIIRIGITTGTILIGDIPAGEVVPSFVRIVRE